MNFWNFVLRCLVIGIIAFAVGILVSFLFFLIIHGKADVAWGVMFRYAAVLGVMLPLAERIKIGKE
ncbi:MAG: hypothetical protein WC372_05345 [Candidatus Neomarinimicrobiota bacterium]|nr:hypothetical protein [Candidatus Neomarinimicrobiota bacterium]MDD3966599.1 hypothetical protein [Candidatus Neomarinimicrobiota bacterium]MDX9780035.1 hypothetical protein [bacterium]